MNARQKAKKYKKIAERYKDDAEAWNRYIKAEMFKNATKRRYGTIETYKVVEYWDDRVPDEVVKEELSVTMAKCLMRDGYIDFKISDNYNEYNMCRKIVAALKVAKPLGGDEE